MWPVYLHFAVESVVEDKVVGHAYAVGFHGVALAVVVVADVTVVVVADSTPGLVGQSEIGLGGIHFVLDVLD